MLLQGLSAQHYNEELAVADQLLQLVDPSRVAVAADQLAAVQEEHGNAAAQYMAAVRNMLQMSSSSLADIPNKVVFCRQRIAQVSNRQHRAASWQEGYMQGQELPCHRWICIYYIMLLYVALYAPLH